MSDKLTDKLVGAGEKPELSPNPYGSGYTKQVEVDTLSSVVNPEENVLYICQGRTYKYLEQAIIDPAANKVLVPAGFVRVENGPQVHNVDGGRGTPVHENVAPQVQPRVFNEPVALNGGVTIKGKQIEDYIDSEGGVTEEELANAIAGVESKTPAIFMVTDETRLTTAMAQKMKDGDIIILNAHIGFVIRKEDSDDPEGILITGVFLSSNGDRQSLSWTYNNRFDECIDDIEPVTVVHTMTFNQGEMTIQLITRKYNDFDTAEALYNWLTNKGFTHQNHQILKELYGVFGADASAGTSIWSVYTEIGSTNQHRLIQFDSGNFTKTIDIDDDEFQYTHSQYEVQ